MKKLLTLTFCIITLQGIFAQTQTDRPLDSQKEEIFRVVEVMPRFPGCEDLSSEPEKRACADKKMIEFVYKNLQYPDEARRNNIEGIAIATFVVEKDGTVTNAKVVRDIGYGCGEEALRLINLMNEQNLMWTPGLLNGNPVRVQFNLPIRFKL